MAVRIVIVVCILLLGCTPRQYVKKVKKRQVVSEVVLSGGSGESFQEAVIITGTKNQSESVDAEYQFISKIHGQRGIGWHLVGQTVIREKNKIADVIEIQLRDSSDRRIYYFDVTDFLGKRK